MKHFFLVLACLSFISSFGQQDSSNVLNAQQFHDVILDQGGTWIAENPDYDSTNEKDFTFFLLLFERDAMGTVHATVSGMTGKNEVIQFWKVLEFVDAAKDQVHFIQTGEMGYAISQSQFRSPVERVCEFELNWKGGFVEKNRDMHTLKGHDRFTSVSSVYDEETRTWNDSSKLEWNRDVAE
ncbi:MAG: hypothetical protein HKN32_06900 [Flavobacteriales bacterium]|nr:hypothetical protein [Flavobacteriales bacterium]